MANKSSISSFCVDDSSDDSSASESAESSNALLNESSKDLLNASSKDASDDSNPSEDAPKISSINESMESELSFESIVSFAS